MNQKLWLRIEDEYILPSFQKILNQQPKQAFQDHLYLVTYF